MLSYLSSLEMLILDPHIEIPVRTHEDGRGEPVSFSRKYADCMTPTGCYQRNNHVPTLLHVLLTLEPFSHKSYYLNS